MSRNATSEMIGDVEAKTYEAKAAAQDFVNRASDRATDAYATAREIADAVDPFVKDRPYAALALAIIAGVILGGLFLGRGPKVVYLKPRE